MKNAVALFVTWAVVRDAQADLSPVRRAKGHGQSVESSLHDPMSSPIRRDFVHVTEHVDSNTMEKLRPINKARREAGDASKDGVTKLCEKFGWPVRLTETPAPRIFYGIVTNGEDQPLLEAHIHQVYDFVHRFVVVEGRVTQAGFESPYPAVDYTSESFNRFAPKLRNITYTETMFKELFQSECDGDKLTSESHNKGDCKAWARQNGQRKLIAEGFKNPTSGTTELTENDVVIVADIDEIPMGDAMRAVSECEPPAFSAARHDFRTGKKPCADGTKTKVIFRSQYVYFHVDCPLRKLWWHPDAVSAVCLLHGGWNTYDVRHKKGGVMTERVAGFHLHNVGRTDEQLEFKYKTYGEPCCPSDAICHPGNVPEMRKRTCDNSTPPLGPYNWTFAQRALNDLVEPGQERTFLNDDVATSWESFLSIAAEKPQQYSHFFWKSRQR